MTTPSRILAAALLGVLVACSGPAVSSRTTDGSSGAPSSRPTAPQGPAAGTRTPARPEKPEPGPPNIVLLMTDDQNRDELRWMPRTQRLLGDHGVTFSRALSPAPLCCPARAMTLTGQYGQNNGVRDNFGPFGGFDALDDKGNTLATWLQRAGYQTALVGKYLNGYGEDGSPPQRGWTRWNPSVGNVYGYHGTVFLDDTGSRVTPDGNVTSYISARTDELVRTFSATDEPFFIWASHVPPHGAYTGTDEMGALQWGPPRASPRSRRVLRDVPLPSLSKPSFNADGEGLDPYPQPPMSDDRVDRTRAVFTGRLQSLRDVDRAVESLVSVLEETGELANTYIVFVSDNGQLLGEHRLVTKDVLYREALEIPLVVRVPDARNGTVSPLPATIVDLAPTILELAGATPGRLLDGVSFAPALRGRTIGWRDTQLIQTGSDEPGGTGWDFRGVRTGRFTYMRRVSDGAEFLFDRRDDPFETTNLVWAPEYLPVLQALQRRHDLLIDCSGESCHRSFGPLPAPG